ncbi:cytochrome P450 [Haladaptatus sp. AB643]|uniref:cytochrome P450 n=1 Tax=Haladaptatus sp. AB643 TaxID=2934174 RepID=UPI00209C6C1A|nr:cytochrome P450 [Haladaptatus sp. AB643]MCO8243674.1 cytochrome P450 [Haladaptatus sp. AB643]
MANQNPELDRRLPKGLEPSERRMDPFPWYETMRRTEPVRYDEERERWDVFGYDDVKRVLSDYETFSSAELSDFDPFGSLGTVLVDENPPEHSRIRGIVDEYFRPGNLESLRPSIRAIADDQLDEALASGPDIDVISELTAPVTARTISRLLGIPADQWDIIKRWTGAMEGAKGDPQKLFAEVREYFGELIEERRVTGGDDLISVITDTDSHDVPLSKEEQVSFCIFLFLAGHSTTTHAVGNALWTLDEEGYYADLRDGAIDPKMTFEEVLRYRGPVQSLSGRVTTEEVELSGTVIPAGEQITSWIGSANRDSAVFDDPEEFRPERRANRPIAFGFGPHHCLGAPLAKLEGNIILDAVTDHVEDIEVLSESVDPVTSPVSYGFDRLPMKFYT